MTHRRSITSSISCSIESSLYNDDCGE
jgi:hypothetical protein